MTSTTKPKKAAKKAPRKTYSIAADQAHLLAQVSLTLTQQKGKHVGRQDVLDALVETLNDKKVLERVAARLV